MKGGREGEPARWPLRGQRVGGPGGPEVAAEAARAEPRKRAAREVRARGRRLRAEAPAVAAQGDAEGRSAFEICLPPANPVRPYSAQAGQSRGRG